MLRLGAAGRSTPSERMGRGFPDGVRCPFTAHAHRLGEAVRAGSPPATPTLADVAMVVCERKVRGSTRLLVYDEALIEEGA